jgi:hypothetical protein
MELIMCWKITRAGTKANPALRVNMGYLMVGHTLEEDVLKRPMKANLA